MRLEKRNHSSPAALVLAPVGAVLFTLLVSSLLVLWAGAPVAQTFGLLFKGAFGDAFSWQNTLQRAARLMLTALAVALREHRIAAAGLDVFEGEPSVHPDLLTVPNVVLTPHIASATVPTRRAMANLAADNLIAFFDGRGPLTPVNQPASLR